MKLHSIAIKLSQPAGSQRPDQAVFELPQGDNIDHVAFDTKVVNGVFYLTVQWCELNADDKRRLEQARRDAALRQRLVQ